MNSLSNARTICPLSSAQTDTGGQKAPPSVGRASPEDRVAQKQCANCDILYADKSATVYNCNACITFIAAPDPAHSVIFRIAISFIAW
jgi:hypothetical protein